MSGKRDTKQAEFIDHAELVVEFDRLKADYGALLARLTPPDGCNDVFIVPLQPRHAEHVRASAAAEGMTPEKYIERLVRVGYNTRPAKNTHTVSGEKIG